MTFARLTPLLLVISLVIACDKGGPVSLAMTDSEVSSSFGNTGDGNTELDVTTGNVYISTQSRLYVTPTTTTNTQREKLDAEQPTVLYKVNDATIEIAGETLPATLEVGGTAGLMSHIVYGDIDSNDEKLFKWTAELPAASREKFKDSCDKSVKATVKGTWIFEKVSDPELLKYDGVKSKAFSHDFDVDVRC